MTINNRMEALWQKVKVAGLPTDEDRKELFQILHNPVMIRMLRGMIDNSDTALIQLTNADLISEDGRLQAVKVQAAAKMYAAIAGDLIEFACGEAEVKQNQTEKETTNDGHE